MENVTKNRTGAQDHIARIELAIQATLAFDLNTSESSLLHVIAHRDGDGRGCFLSSVNLVKASGIGHRSTFYKALGKLESLGLITSQSVGKRRPTIRRFRAGEIQIDGETEDSSMVQNRTKDGAKMNQGMVQNRTTNLTGTRHEPATPVGVVGSSLEPGERVLTFDGALRLTTRPIEAGGKMSGPLIAAPTRETPLSLADDARCKGWNAWIAAEKPAVDERSVRWALWAFAIFVWHQMKMKPNKANLSRAWSKHQWTMRDEDCLTILNGEIVGWHANAPSGS